LTQAKKAKCKKNMKNSCQVQQTRLTLRLKACNTQECGYKSNCWQEEPHPHPFSLLVSPKGLLTNDKWQLKETPSREAFPSVRQENFLEFSRDLRIIIYVTKVS